MKEKNSFFSGKKKRIFDFLYPVPHDRYQGKKLISLANAGLLQIWLYQKNYYVNL